VSEPPTIRAHRLSKWYGRVTALQEVTLDLPPGIWGLLGPNGSGKTTFLKMAAGLLKPSLGAIRVAGVDPFANTEAHRRIGLCPEADALYEDLTALQFVSSMAELSGYAPTEARQRATDALSAFGLSDAMNRRMGGYSRGMRQRAKLAQAIVHDPDVLLLDEPLTGTDPVSRTTILNEIRKRADAGGLVIFSTHVLHEVEALTEQLLLIADGNLVAQGGVAEIRTLLDEHPHHIQVECDRPRDLAAALVGQEGVGGLSFPKAYHLDVYTHRPEDTYRTIAKTLVSNGFKYRRITSPDASLQALFYYLVERGRRRATVAKVPDHPSQTPAAGATP